MADASMRGAAKKEQNSAGDSAGSKREPASNGRSTRRSPKKSNTANSPDKRTTGTSKRTGANQQTGTGRRTYNVPPHLAEVEPSTAPRKVTMGSRTRAATLRIDLQKFGREEYVPEDFVNGAQLIIDAGAGERLRDLVASVLRSKGAFGNMQSENVMEGLLDQLSDGYRKRKVAERKSIRAMLNWCSGLVETEQEVEGQLLTKVLSQGSSPE